MQEQIKRRISFPAFKEEVRKIGVNFITAGVVGVFIYHYVGINLIDMLWSSLWITLMGGIALYFGIRKRGVK